MRNFIINFVGTTAGLATTLFIYHRMTKEPVVSPPAKDNIRFVGRANFAQSEVQFSEVHGDNMICMVAFHTNAETRMLVANMQCSKK